MPLVTRIAAVVLCVASCLAMGLLSTAHAAEPAIVCTTKLDGSIRLAETQVSSSPRSETPDATITIDERVVMQSMDGFGFCLTQGSAWVMRHKMSDSQRAGLLKELFTIENGGIGVSALRIPIGASDLSTHVYTYDDTSTPDLSLASFSLGEDLNDLVPVLQEIRLLAPKITIMASPWTPPLWMKTNQAAKGGSLRTEYYSLYAQYFVRYLREMESKGIPIHSITIQNEPENPHNTPSLAMTAAEQCEFVRDHLGPAMAKANRKERIVIYDHNCDHPEYPLQILSDPVAASFIDGSAFHLYAGNISALGKVHDKFPNKSVYFTEQWLSSEGQFGPDLNWHAENVVIGATNNWARMVLEWNLANDENMQPHTDGGCDKCLGAVTIDRGSVTRNASYYAIAHASRYVPQGSVRIQSASASPHQHVAFKTPDNKHVLIILNPSDSERSLTIDSKLPAIEVTLPSRSISTVRW